MDSHKKDLFTIAGKYLDEIREDAGNPYHNKAGQFTSNGGAASKAKETIANKAIQIAHTASSTANTHDTHQLHQVAADEHRNAASKLLIADKHAEAIHHYSVAEEHQSKANTGRPAKSAKEVEKESPYSSEHERTRIILSGNYTPSQVNFETRNTLAGYLASSRKMFSPKSIAQQYGHHMAKHSDLFTVNELQAKKIRK